jgi:hypothetical protein
MAMLLEAVVAAGLTLYAGRHNASVLLPLIFVVWVIAPFVAIVTLNLQHVAMVVVTLLSLGIYGVVAFGLIQAKIGSVFLVVPLASWVTIAVRVLHARR